MMNAEWIPYVGGAVVSVVTAVVSALLTRRKYTTETRRTELDNVREGNEILMDNVVKPLEVHIKRLNKNVTRLEKAIGQIPACPHSAECPVTRELLAGEKDDDEPENNYGDRGADNTRSRGQNRQRRDRDFDRRAAYPADGFD